MAREVIEVAAELGMPGAVVDVTDTAATAAAIGALDGVDGLVHAAGRVIPEPVGG